jgi:hypothetical protein
MPDEPIVDSPAAPDATADMVSRDQMPLGYDAGVDAGASGESGILDAAWAPGQ